jgi:hypothetical protein
LISDLDQALVLIGACFEGSGLNAMDTLKNENFRTHIALFSILEWFVKHGPDADTKNAAFKALAIFKDWRAKEARNEKMKSRPVETIRGRRNLTEDYDLKPE